MISWEPVAGADYYDVYHAAFAHLQRRKVGSRVEGTTYLHTTPSTKWGNHYWVVACNSDGCSDPSKAAFIDKRPAGPAEVQYRYIEAEEKTRITWAAVEGAHYYNVYWDEFPFDDCEIDRFGIPHTTINCEFLEKDVNVTYIDDPGVPKDYYWVSACNRSGCSVPARAVRR